MSALTRTTTIISETDSSSQAEIKCSPAVAVVIERNQKRLLSIKRGSLWSLANMAAASNDALMESIENVDDEEIIKRGRSFIENVRGFVKLFNNFRDTRGAK
jgi:hypothetical protein